MNDGNHSPDTFGFVIQSVMIRPSAGQDCKCTIVAFSRVTLSDAVTRTEISVSFFLSTEVDYLLVVLLLCPPPDCL